MATATASIITAITSIASIGLQTAGMISSGIAAGREKEEAIGDYLAAIEQVKERRTETVAEAKRQIGTTKEEGILSLKEQGAQAAFEGRMVMTQAEMVASSEEARLGASGVRPGGSPLMAAQQNVDLAFAAADRTIEKGRAGMAIGGTRLKTAMADIGAKETLLTAEYARQIKEYRRRLKELYGTNGTSGGSSGGSDGSGSGGYGGYGGSGGSGGYGGMGPWG